VTKNVIHEMGMAVNQWFRPRHVQTSTHIVTRRPELCCSAWNKYFLQRISSQATSHHKGDAVGSSSKFFIWKSISRNIAHPQSYNI